MTETGIKEAAREYNRAYPEAAAEINAGEAMILVLCETTGTGWRLHVTVTPGVRAPGGGWISAADPVGERITARDGRLTPQECARRTLASRFAGVHVPINYERAGAR